LPDVGLNENVRFQTLDGLQNYRQEIFQNFREDEIILPKESAQKSKL
jgi:hypothetical protein